MKPTFITGMARIGNAMRQATIRVEAEHQSVIRQVLRRPVRRTYVATTMSGATFDPWNARWRTLRANRNAAAAAIHQDGRLSTSGPGLFAYSAVSITKRDGTLMGAEESFDGFVEHMLRAGGDDTYRGETVEDRVTVAVEVLTQSNWTE